MTRAYRYLRTLEHRLQMIEDEQTHTVPKSAEGVAHVACFMGHDDVEDFRAALTATLENVQGHYARLFQREADLADAHGNLVFTGVEEDPETLDTLRAMGFGAPSQVAGAIRGWHHGRIRAMRCARARELLTKLIPAILKALAAHRRSRYRLHPVRPFSFQPAVGRAAFLPVPGAAGISRPCWPRWWARRRGWPPIWRAIPPLWMRCWTPISWSRLPIARELDASLARSCKGAYEELLDGARRFAREEIFRVGVQIGGRRGKRRSRRVRPLPASPKA